MTATIAVPIYRFPDAARYLEATLENNAGFPVLLISNNAPAHVVVPCVGVLVNAGVPYTLTHWTKNLFVSAAWNYAVEECDTEYIVLLNDDAIPLRNVIEAFCGLFDSEPGVMLAYPRIVVPGEGMELTEAMREPSVVTVDENIMNKGAYGTFIFMRSSWAKSVFPIPDEYKVWFGDNWIRGKAHEQGLVIPRLHQGVLHKVSASMPRAYNGPGYEGDKTVSKAIKEDCEHWRKEKCY